MYTYYINYGIHLRILNFNKTIGTKNPYTENPEYFKERTILCLTFDVMCHK